MNNEQSPEDNGLALTDPVDIEPEIDPSWWTPEGWEEDVPEQENGNSLGKVPEPPNVKTLLSYRIKEGSSYFETCERDEEGRCLPSGQTGAEPKKRPKKAPKSTEKKRSSKPSKAPDLEVKVKPTKKRAWEGDPVPLKNKISKQDAGKIGEAVVIAYLKSKGFKDARHLNLDRNNFPIDLVQDHESIEVKTGMVSNSKEAMQWRLTIGEPGKTEKEWLAKASLEEKAKWNAKKQQMIHERKRKALEDLSKKLGRKVKAKTMTVLLNPDTKTADVFQFDGWHNRIAWRSEEAKAAYIGSITYE